MNLKTMISFSRILAIGAHPDDIEYGCLGLLLKMGTQTHIYVASSGSSGDPSSGLNRIQESKAALQCLPRNKVIHREEKGVHPADFETVMDDVYKIITEVQPDLILTHSPHDTHQEHRLIYEITIAAARRSKATILSYGILSNTLDFHPQFFADISTVYSAKKKALQCHKSQADKFYMSEEHLDVFHGHNYASLHGLRFCEAYEIVRMFG